VCPGGLRCQRRGRAQFEWQPWVDAANYLLAAHLDANEAVKDAEQSIAIEDRFENEMTLSQALTMLGRGDEASAARKKALALGSQPQIHALARALQAQGRQDEAIELFRENMRKDPSSWVGHNEAARLAVVKGDFDTAVREMTLAASASPDALRGQHADLDSSISCRSWPGALSPLQIPDQITEGTERQTEHETELIRCVLRPDHFAIDDYDVEWKVIRRGRKDGCSQHIQRRPRPGRRAGPRHQRHRKQQASRFDNGERHQHELSRDGVQL